MKLGQHATVVEFCTTCCFLDEPLIRDISRIREFTNRQGYFLTHDRFHALFSVRRRLKIIIVIIIIGTRLLSVMYRQGNEGRDVTMVNLG